MRLPLRTGVLLVLRQGPNYHEGINLSLLRKIRRKPSNLQPALKNLEQEGLIAESFKDWTGARPRTYYHLTAKGRQKVEEMREAFRSLLGI